MAYRCISTPYEIVFVKNAELGLGRWISLPSNGYLGKIQPFTLFRKAYSFKTCRKGFGNIFFLLVGSTRVSTMDQSPSMQMDALRAAGCKKFYVEKASEPDP